MELKNNIVVCGHYGSGKTNLSVNLALHLAREGNAVSVADLDIVNPYFRMADFKELFASRGIELIVPMFANTSLDLPILPPKVDVSIADQNRKFILDVGGEDAGAVALGTYSARLRQFDYTMLYVINCRRRLEDVEEEEIQLIGAIEAASRLNISYLVNNTNLAGETTDELIAASQQQVARISEKTKIPVLFTAVHQNISTQKISGSVFPIDVFVKTPWDDRSNTEREGSKWQK